MNGYNDLIGEIFSSTYLKDILEFSKSVHAEMDAITTAAKLGSTSLKGTTLYTLTFPCHLCARHIISAGVKKVIYLEPYEKSQADKLFRDSIAIDPAGETLDKVVFLHFEGVTPRQYLNLFTSTESRKKDGRAVTRDPKTAKPIVRKFADAVVDYESIIIEYLAENNIISRKNNH
ncbi:MAG: hypothetical protein HQK99_12830 [Nitrospirae bacterium]|nr:hypothetical protein [Nitrospirota bacterium]